MKHLLFGIATFVPGVVKLHALRGTGGTDSARYCYSVWMRHLVMARDSGLNVHPETVAELGPGSSLGIGLCALLSGCERYYAFDVVEHADPARNEKIFDQLVELFRARAPIPGDDQFPRVRPRLDDYSFPADVLTPGVLESSLDSARLGRIRAAIRGQGGPDAMIQYKAPWFRSDVLEAESVDMLFSQAVLEHIDDVEGTYAAMHDSLKPGGFMSHTIDFKCHGTASSWNGHWTYSDFVWKLMRGKRPYLINREPYSTHARNMTDSGFSIVCDKRVILPSQIGLPDLAPGCRHVEEQDLTTSGVFVQATKLPQGQAPG